MHTSRTEHLSVVPVFAKICTEMHVSRAALFFAVRVFSHKYFENHASRAALFFGARVFSHKYFENHASRAALFFAVRVFSHKYFENHASRAALFFGARVFTQKCSEMRTSRAPGLSESLLPLPEQHRTRWNLIFNTINLSVTNFVRRLNTQAVQNRSLVLPRTVCILCRGYFESVLVNTIE